MIHLISPVKKSLQFIFFNEIGIIVKKNFIPAEAGDNSVSFDTSKLAPGVYFFRVIDQEGNSETRRFIK
ncbi:MAG TPA: T9SS type A sorting domain-containing protein [Puia sp.]|nr:T9SS type A sorting domain-containing protein [Puia sp.]